MRRFMNGLVLGVILGGAAAWMLAAKWHHPPVRAVQEPPQTATGHTIEAVGTAVDRLTEKFKAKMEALDLDPQVIKEDLARTGQVVRRKARELTEPVADAAADARITAAIKAKLAIDQDLSALNVSVSTQQGNVTLSGTVASLELISRAVLLAHETDGVREVTSQLQVKARE